MLTVHCSSLNVKLAKFKLAKSAYYHTSVDLCILFPRRSEARNLTYSRFQLCYGPFVKGMEMDYSVIFIFYRLCFFVMQFFVNVTIANIRTLIMKNAK